MDNKCWLTKYVWQTLLNFPKNLTCLVALFNNDDIVEIKNALVFFLVLRVIENFFYKAYLVPGLLHLPHLDPFLVALTLLKPKHLCRPNIGMWGVYPEAMACNVGGLCSDFILGECIWRKSPFWPNLKVHFEIKTSEAFSPDTVTQN